MSPDRPLLVASNRGPVAFDEVDGELVARRGAGGLVTGLTSALQETGGRWVAAALSDADRARAAGGRFTEEAGGVTYDLRYLVLDPETFDAHYNGFANRILWFCHHYLWNISRTPYFGPGTDAWWAAYRDVNASFADGLAEEVADLGGAPAVLVQDYHLCLVPRLLRERAPGCLVAHFWHIPFAGPTYFRVMPDALREALLGGLLGADLVGFQARRWADNFLECCAELRGVDVDRATGIVRRDGHATLVRVHPIQIDADALREEAGGERVRALSEEFDAETGDLRLIARADRMELSKNVLRGFAAYAQLLEQHPEWRGNVRMVARLYPSRLAVPEYREYADECVAAAEDVNERFGGHGWQPVALALRDDYEEALALYRRYDVLLVNPVFDGLNLVAKEGPAVNTRDGVVVLSRGAGAFDELGDHVLGVNPFDVGATAEALHAALSMPREERSRRAAALRAAVTATSPAAWVRRQLDDLERAAAGAG